MIHANEKVISRDGQHVGFTTGSTHRCPLMGCNGLRATVKWNDGKRTFPCTKGMTRHDNVWTLT